MSQQERKRRYLRKKKIEKYGIEYADVDMRGKHGNHATGTQNGRWASDRRITDQGYVAVRVALNHPHGWGSPRLKNFRYAYEHHVIAMQILKRPLRDDEVVHHKNGQRNDNRPENLEILSRSSHAREHTSLPGTRTRGRFNSNPRHELNGKVVEENEKALEALKAAEEVQ